MTDDKEIKCSELLSQVNSEDRPWVIVLFSGLLTLLFGTLIPVTDNIANTCSFGIVFSMTTVMFSLLIIQMRRKLYSGIPVTLLAFGITTALLGTRITAAGATMHEKLINLSPIIISALLGYFIMADRPRKPTKKNDHVKELLEREDRGDVAP